MVWGIENYGIRKGIESMSVMHIAIRKILAPGKGTKDMRGKNE